MGALLLPRFAQWRALVSSADVPRDLLKGRLDGYLGTPLYELGIVYANQMRRGAERPRANIDA